MRQSAMLILLALALAHVSARPLHAAEAPAQTGEIVKFVEDEKYVLPEPLKRGEEFRTPGSPTTMEKQPVIWGWSIELPDGSGLLFGGRSLRTDDPCVHTQIRQQGEWKSIAEDLKKKNPLQTNHETLKALRGPLLHITGLARHIYLEGLDEATSTARFDKDVAPKRTELLSKLKEARAALSKSGGANAYATEQSNFALMHLDKAMPAIEGLASRISPESLNALRQSRISLEQAADSLGAEPPPRAHSMPAFDAKTGCYVYFGGDHLDYLSNDIWVFDSKEKQWQQRHPKLSPEPRALHSLNGDGSGKVKLRGGYVYGRQGMKGTYSHAGPEEFVYDIQANAWQFPVGIQGCADSTREFRQGAFLPDNFTADPKPDAASHKKLLSELPANTWVDLKPTLRFAWNRDWGTLAFDPDRDLIYWYTGGHSAYPGTDVAHYHLATNRWDQLVETELPPGYIGSNEAMIGWSFNRRPFMGHSYASYAYHSILRKMIVNGRQTLNGKAYDANTYVYDPDVGDWIDRKPTPANFDRHHAKLRWIPNFGMITWYGDKLWKLDDASLNWTPLDVKGKVPNTICDHSGLVYDSKRNRVLFFSGGSYSGTPYSGEVFALSLPALEMTSFKPEGAEHIEALSCLNPAGKKQDPAVVWALREVAHHPGSDLFLFGSHLTAGGYTAAFDAKGNRWVGLKLPGPWPYGLQAGLTYDAKRDLFFATNTYANVSALRLDPKTLEIKTFSEIAAEAAKSAPTAK